MRAYFLSILFLCFYQSAQSQKKAGVYHLLKKQISDSLKKLDEYDYWKLDSNSEFDPEELSEKTARKLVSFLQFHQSQKIKEGDLPNLTVLECANKTHALKIFDFGYSCGGSRGWITHPIISWEDSNSKIHAYNLSKKVLCKFYEIHKLKTKDSLQLYLLIGHEQGNGSTIQNIVYVIKLEGGKLVTNYPAFVNRPMLNIGNVELNFDSKKQVLTGKFGSFSNDELFIITQGDYSNNKEANEKLLKWLSPKWGEDGSSEFKLRFNGKQFVGTR